MGWGERRGLGDSPGFPWIGKQEIKGCGDGFADRDAADTLEFGPILAPPEKPTMGGFGHGDAEFDVAHAHTSAGDK